MAHYLNTPQTEAIDRTRGSIDFSELPTFAAPADGDDLVKAMRGNKAKYAPIRTPSARAPLAGRPNPPAKQEFTPMLKSAVKNSISYQIGSATPAAKNAFPYSSPGLPDLPERSMLGESVMSSTDHTSMVPHSSSTMGTPLPAIATRGEMGLNNGNLLTLKEQEAKLEQIDKENFGLKLKIHFLEEHLKKSGTDYNQDTIKQNTELKANNIILDREIKKYLKQLKRNEVEIEQYRLQLEQYKEKVRNRHMTEAMRDELEQYKNLAEQREQELQALREQIDKMQASGNTENLDLARDQIEDLESDIRDKQRVIDEKEEQIEDLEAKLREMENGDELNQKDDKIEQLQEELEQLQHQIQQLQQEHEEFEEKQDDFDALKREHASEVEGLQSKLEAERRQARDQQQSFESQLATLRREKDAEIEALRRKLQNSEEDKASQIESLESRLKLAQAQGDDQSNSVQQAVADAEEKLRIVALKKDAEIEELQAQVDDLQGLQDELDLVRRQWETANEDVATLEQEIARKNDEAAEMREELSEKSRDIRTLRSPSKSPVKAQNSEQIERLQQVLSERTNKIVSLQQTIESQTSELESVEHVKSQNILLEQRITRITEEMSTVRADISDRDRQLESVKKTLQERSAELEIQRNAANEPNAQLEGLQSIVRSRDQNLVELRNKMNQQEKDLDTFQRLAAERLKAMDELKSQFAGEKQDLQDEIEVLECSLDEAEEKVTNLVNELQSHESPRKFTHLQEQLRLRSEERIKLQKTIDDLRKDQDIADADRLATHDTITKLRADLRAAQEAVKTTSPLARGTTAELKSLRFEQRDYQSRMLEAETALESAESRHLESTRQLNIEIRKLRQQVREKEKLLEDLQSDTMKHIHAGSKAQEAREEAGRLSAKMIESEKRHIAEMKGLVKQIQVLRAKLDREKTFRGELAFQKRWFLLMVDMYDACNANNIRMIEEMGISPSYQDRNQRPTLKSAAQAVMFCLRVKKATSNWADQKRVQESLSRKMEARKAKGKRVLMR